MGIRFMLLILCVLSAVLSIQAFAVEADDIVIDGNFKDWEKIPVSVEDPEDQANNPSGDYKALKVATNGDSASYRLPTVKSHCLMENDATPCSDWC